MIDSLDLKNIYNQKILIYFKIKKKMYTERKLTQSFYKWNLEQRIHTEIMLGLIEGKGIGWGRGFGFTETWKDCTKFQQNTCQEWKQH